MGIINKTPNEIINEIIQLNNKNQKDNVIKELNNNFIQKDNKQKVIKELNNKIQKDNKQKVIKELNNNFIQKDNKQKVIKELKEALEISEEENKNYEYIVIENKTFSIDKRFI